MAYPKRTEFEKTAFVAKVFNLLKTNGKLVQYNNLEKETDLDKRYESAKRYNLEMGYKYEDVMGLTKPRTDFDIATASSEEATEGTEESDVRVTPMTAQEVQEHIHNQPSKSRYKQKQQDVTKQMKKARKVELMEKHYELLDWLQCIDDGIIKGDIHQAKKIIDTLDDYASRLHNLMDSVYVERAKKVYMQLMEIENVLGKQDMEKIRKEVEACVPINA